MTPWNNLLKEPTNSISSCFPFIFGIRMIQEIYSPEAHESKLKSENKYF